MSADNWRVCPQCVAKERAEVAALKKLADKSYGKVSAQEWQSKIAAIAERESLEDDMPASLREDYELWIDDNGKFHVSYRASCQDCPYKFSFKHEYQTEFEERR